jgi:hypothetical protein
MSGLQRLVLVAIAAAIGMTTFFSVDRHCRSVARIAPTYEPTALADAPYDPMGLADSPHEPVVLTEPLDDVRKAERSRRAQRPAGDPERKNGLNYEGVLKGLRGRGTQPSPKPAEPMPPTSCRAVEPAPKHADPFSGPHRLHYVTVALFETASGFGFWRMFTTENDRGVAVASRAVDRVELVSLLTDYQPSVYVLDEMATPTLARRAKRRPLDEFERLGLDALRRGEELVWTREAPTRMFGAIRARADCLDCHANARVGDLLGAFTYYLNAPVDKLKVRE